MKKICRFLLLTTFLIFALAPVAMASPINDAGYFKGIRLAGKVKVVEYNADIKVQIVEHFPDLKVQAVEHFPDDIGQWQFVEYGEDFTIEYVNSFPDFTIQFVEHFPGL